jgi:hypothetical protein
VVAASPSGIAIGRRELAALGALLALGAVLRVTSGSLDRARIIAAAQRAQTTVVGRAFRLVPGLEAALARRYDRVVEVGDARVYLR